WALSDVKTGRYLAHSRVDAQAPRIGLEKIKQGHGSKDPRLNRAMVELLEKGRVPRPDRMFQGPVNVALDRLSLDYAGERFEKTDAGYALNLFDSETRHGVQVVFKPLKPPLRHGND